MGKDKELRDKVKKIEEELGTGTAWTLSDTIMLGTNPSIVGRLSRIEAELKDLTHTSCNTCGTVVRKSTS